MSVMNTSFTPLQRSSKTALESVDPTAFKDFHSASFERMEITANGRAQQAKIVYSDSQQTLKGDLQHKPTSTEGCKSGNRPASRVTNQKSSPKTGKVKLRAPHNNRSTNKLSSTCCRNLNLCSTVILATSQWKNIALRYDNRIQCQYARHLIELVQKRASSKRLRLMRCSGMSSSLQN